ncbi:MAG: polysaccharide pyruvyl transferase family protein [Candidatus Competibacteraceae bacterium]
MKLYYFHDPVGNFGDDLNPWIWDQLLPDFFDDDPDILFVGIGTLLNHRVPLAAKRVVFGSGVGYGLPLIKDETWDFICVRGPWSAGQLGVEPCRAVADPAIFINHLFPHSHAERYLVSFMPAGISASRGLWREVCQIADIQYIDPHDDVEKVMKQIDLTRLLISEAMHGAIAAEAFRIPWISVYSGDHMNYNKWQDFCGSLDLIHQPYQLPTTHRGNDGQLSFLNKSKMIIKRLLSDTGFWSSRWTKPDPRRSSDRELERAAEILFDI